MRPRKVAEKLRKRWGKTLYIAPNRPGGSTSASSGTNTSWSNMSRLTVARIPIGSHSPGKDTPGASEIQGALDPGLVAEPDGRGGVIRGAARQRDEKLPPVHHIAAIHLPRGGAEAPAARTEPGIGLALLHRLAVRLSIKGAV